MKKSSSLLDGVSFEDIMSEKAIQSERPNRGTQSSEITSNPRSRSASSNSSVNFSILENYGKLSSRKNAATFALVDWNGFSRYDLRSWSDDYTTPYKGITFLEDEIPDLITALARYKPSLYSEMQYTYSAGKANAKIY